MPNWEFRRRGSEDGQHDPTRPRSLRDRVNAELSENTRRQERAHRAAQYAEEAKQYHARNAAAQRQLAPQRDRQLKGVAPIRAWNEEDAQACADFLSLMREHNVEGNPLVGGMRTTILTMRGYRDEAKGFKIGRVDANGANGQEYQPNNPRYWEAYLCKDGLLRATVNDRSIRCLPYDNNGQPRAPEIGHYSTRQAENPRYNPDAGYGERHITETYFSHRALGDLLTSMAVGYIERDWRG